MFECIELATELYRFDIYWESIVSLIYANGEKPDILLRRHPMLFCKPAPCYAYTPFCSLVFILPYFVFGF